jgi:ArsR family transcriptional regulator
MKKSAAVFRALADESRLRIYSLLRASGELCVCDIEETLGFTQTKVSRHLSYLRRAGLVKDRKQGLWMIYSASEPKNGEEKRLLQTIAENLKATRAAQKDAKRLQHSIKRGCCTPYAMLSSTHWIQASKISLPNNEKER